MTLLSEIGNHERLLVLREFTQQRLDLVTTSNTYTHLDAYVEVAAAATYLATIAPTYDNSVDQVLSDLTFVLVGVNVRSRGDGIYWAGRESETGIGRQTGFDDLFLNPNPSDDQVAHSVGGMTLQYQYSTLFRAAAVWWESVDGEQYDADLYEASFDVITEAESTGYLQFPELIRDLLGDGEAGFVDLWHVNGGAQLALDTNLQNLLNALDPLEVSNPPDYADTLPWDQCFPAGTSITLSDGTTKPIEAITQSDVVLTHDANGNPTPGVVTKLFTNTTREFIRLSFADGRDDLVATPGHRFLTETSDYMEIGHMLRLGGGTVRVVDVDGSIIEAVGEVIAYSAETAHMFEQSAIKTIAFEGNTVLKEDVEQGWTTYNFEVAEHHNYVAGGVRVHNDSILSQLQEGDTLIALNDDLTDAAVLRDVDGVDGDGPDGNLDFVTLDGFRRDGEATEIALERVYINPTEADYAAQIAEEMKKSYVDAQQVASNVFDPGNGSNWNDYKENGSLNDDIEETFFNDIVKSGATGTDRAEIDRLYTTYFFRGIDLTALVKSGDVVGSQELIDAIAEAATDPVDALAIATFLLEAVGAVTDGPLGLSGEGIVLTALAAWCVFRGHPATCTDSIRPPVPI